MPDCGPINLKTIIDRGLGIHLIKNSAPSKPKFTFSLADHDKVGVDPDNIPNFEVLIGHYRHQKEEKVDRKIENIQPKG